VTRVPILTFHSIDPSGSAISFATDDLRHYLTSLAHQGWRGVTVSDAIARQGEQKVVGICFDDGYRNVLDEALPILRDCGFSATVFAISSRCGKDNQWAGQAECVPALPLLDWSEIERLASAGWEIGSHGAEHLRLTSVHIDRAAQDVGAAREEIGRQLGNVPTVFAYPYGAWNRELRAVVRESYAAAVSTRLGFVLDEDLRDPTALPRIDAYYLRGTARRFALDGALTSGYVALRRVARRLLRGAPHDL